MTRAATPDEIADHDRDLRKHYWSYGPRPTFDQRCAVARLVGYAEAIASSGLIGELEPNLRAAIAETLAAFDMPSKAEREDA